MTAVPPYILAKTMAEAHAFAQDVLGLDRGYYRLVMSPGTLKAVRGADLYLVPGYEKRHDRFAMAMALRWTRMTVHDPEAEVPEVTDGLHPAGVQQTLDGVDPETAAAFEAFLGKDDENTSEAESGSTPEPETEEQAEESAPRRRRRRCPDCGILVEPDEYDQHVAEHLPEEV